MTCEIIRRSGTSSCRRLQGGFRRQPTRSQLKLVRTEPRPADQPRYAWRVKPPQPLDNHHDSMSDLSEPLWITDAGGQVQSGLS